MPYLVILPTISTLWKELALSCVVEKQPCSYCLSAEQPTGVSQKKEYVSRAEALLRQAGTTGLQGLNCNKNLISALLNLTSYFEVYQNVQSLALRSSLK